MEEDLSKSADRIKAIAEDKMSEFLTGKSKEERFQILRHDLGAKTLAWTFKTAFNREDYEICASIKEVQEDNLESFEVNFSKEPAEEYKAAVVHFRENEIDYFHVDYHSDGEDDQTLVMLHKNKMGNGFPNGPQLIRECKINCVRS